MKALKIIWMFCTIALFSACTTEDIIESSGSTGIDGEATTAIAISVDNLLPVNMNSRGTIDDLLSQVNDLNIRVTIKSSDNSKEKYTYIYCTSNGNITVDGKPVDSSKTYNIDGKMGYIHCNDISAVQVKKVQVIANYGSDLHNNKNWESIVENDDNNFLSQGYCMMYGETSSSNSNEHNGQGSLNCQLFKVELKRTRAMLTVALQGTDELKSGVSITPKKISLYNIPTQCSLLSENMATDVAHKNGESHNIDWGTITSGVTVGTHADMNSDLPNNFLPLYLFENLGGKTNNTSGKNTFKYPQGCNNIEDAKKNKTHSYVEIEADYRYEEGGFLKNSGTIVYRFFLGENDLDDFNVRRNMYHRLTLRLKGFGGADEDGKVKDGKLVVNEEDLSWRVDMEITDWGFEKDAYTFDAHASFGYFEIMGNGWQVTTPNNQDQWVKFYLSKSQSGVNWSENANSKFTVGDEGKLYYYIEPYYYINYKDKDYNTKRTTTVTLTKGSETKTVTFTQYVPIKIKVNDNTTVFMERFEEENEHKWGCENQTINNAIKLNGKGGNIIEDYNIDDYTYAVAPFFDLDKTKRNTLYMHYAALNNIFKSDAHSYCIEKSGKNYMNEPKVASLNSSSNEEIYCLPSKEIFTAMKDFDFSQLDKGSYEPIWLNEDYWVSDIDKSGKTSTYWNGQIYVNGDRSLSKRVRAIYIDYWSNNK